MQTNALIVSFASATRIYEDDLGENPGEEARLMMLCQSLRLAGVGRICILIPYKAEAFRRKTSLLDIEVNEGCDVSPKTIRGYVNAYRMVNPGQQMLLIAGDIPDNSMKTIRKALTMPAAEDMDPSGTFPSVQLLFAR